MFKNIKNLQFAPALVGLAAALSLAACDSGEPDSSELRAGEIDPSPAPAPELAVTPAVDPGMANPELPLREQLMTLQPRKTRAGWLRFTDPVINNPAAAPVLIERLGAGEDSPEVRAALAEAIGRTGADYAAEVSALIATEQDARVREFLVGTLGRQADSSAALVGLAAGLVDAEAPVRAQAAMTLAQRVDGAELGDALVVALADADAGVRASSARTLGVLQAGGTDSIAALEPLLADADPKVRLNALRAIDRIDPAHAAGLGVLASLEQDGDARIQRLATSIRQR